MDTQQLGTAGFWLTLSGHLKRSTDPGNFGEEYGETCTASKGGTFVAVWDTGGMTNGTEICAALTAANWNVN